MNIKKFRKNLRKIKAIIGDEDVALNSIEKELVKSYLLSMYESFDNGSESKSIVIDSKPNVYSFEEEVPEDIPDIEELKEEEENTTEGIVHELHTSNTDNYVEEEEVETPEPEVEKEIQPEHIHEAELNTNVEARPLLDPELFNFKSGKDISDRLNNLPIADLTRCMGINEYIFTKDELFHGDKDRMVDSLAKLNDLSNFSLAKIHLEDLASEFEWDSPTKLNKAKNFINLVRRKFN